LRSKVGSGPAVVRGKPVKMLYKGLLESGKQFDSCLNRKQPFSFRYGLGEVIKGMDQGIKGMQRGGKRIVTIPSHLG
jgi:FKBP-type peptidyl-prolyl cis-trans isomerase